MRLYVSVCFVKKDLPGEEQKACAHMLLLDITRLVCSVNILKAASVYSNESRIILLCYKSLFKYL